MRIGASKAQSRVGKKQVMAYLWPLQAEAAYRRAEREGLTNQEIVTEAINASLTKHGVGTIIPIGHERLFRRTRGRAAPKTESSAAPSRAGKQGIGAWLNRDVVDDINRHAAALGMSIPALLEEGFHLTTGVRGRTLEEIRDGLSASGMDADDGAGMD